MEVAVFRRCGFDRCSFIDAACGWMAGAWNVCDAFRRRANCAIAGCLLVRIAAADGTTAGDLDLSVTLISPTVKSYLVSVMPALPPTRHVVLRSELGAVDCTSVHSSKTRCFYVDRARQMFHDYLDTCAECSHCAIDWARRFASCGCLKFYF